MCLWAAGLDINQNSEVSLTPTLLFIIKEGDVGVRDRPKP